MQSTLVFSYLIFHTNFVRYLQNTNRIFFIVYCSLSYFLKPVTEVTIKKDETINMS